MVTAEEHRRIAWDCLKFGSYLEPANTCGTAQSRPILGQDGAEEAERQSMGVAQNVNDRAEFAI
jgi:hypothetical protein